MNSPPAPPEANVAGTIAENHATEKAPPKSVPLLRPAAGIRMRRLPASVRDTVLRAPNGRVMPPNVTLERSSLGPCGRGTRPPSPGGLSQQLGGRAQRTAPRPK